jgi:hypothetical protein
MAKFPASKSGGGELPAVEAVHVVGTVGQPAFLNGWKNIGEPFAQCGFYKDPFGRVFLQGTVESGTTETPIFILPEAYWLKFRKGFYGLSGSSGEPGAFQVRENGEVYVVRFQSYLYIDGAHWRVGA